jgi:hypothetical protein
MNVVGCTACCESRAGLRKDEGEVGRPGGRIERML